THKTIDIATVMCWRFMLSVLTLTLGKQFQGGFETVENCHCLLLFARRELLRQPHSDSVSYLCCSCSRVWKEFPCCLQLYKRHLPSRNVCTNLRFLVRRE